MGNLFCTPVVRVRSDSPAVPTQSQTRQPSTNFQDIPQTAQIEVKPAPIYENKQKDLDKQEKKWFEAAFDGNSQELTQLLTTTPELIDAVDSCHRTALHHAASGGQDKVVAQLLAVKSTLAQAVGSCNWTALHDAADEGHDRVVGLLLASHPALIHALTSHRQTALHLAASNGHDRVVSQLLTASPEAVNAVDENGWTALHFAASHGNEKVVMRLLAANPGLIHSMDDKGRIALHEADTTVAEMLLAIDPESIYTLDHKANSILHSALVWNRGERLVTRLAKLWPGAICRANQNGETPFLIALRTATAAEVEALQWGLSFDDMRTFARFDRRKLMSVERFQKFLAKECGCLWGVLHKDVVGTVQSYLDFLCLQLPPPTRRRQIDEQ